MGFWIVNGFRDFSWWRVVCLVDSETCLDSWSLCTGVLGESYFLMIFEPSRYRSRNREWGKAGRFRYFVWHSSPYFDMEYLTQLQKTGSSDRTKEKDAIGLGAQMLKIALDFDDGLNRGMSVKSVLAEMRNRPDEYNQRLLAALNEIEIEDPDRIVKSVFVRELTTSMIIDEDVRGNGGVMLVARGQEVSEFVVQFLRNYTRGVGVEEPFRVILKVKK